MCRLRDINRAIVELERQFLQQFDVNINEAMLLCTKMSINIGCPRIGNDAGKVKHRLVGDIAHSGCLLFSGYG